MANDLFVAADLTTEQTRLVLGTLSDGRLQIEEIHRVANASGRLNGSAQWSLLSIWEELKIGLRKCGADRRKPGAAAQRTIESIGISAWGADFGLLAANGDVIGNPLRGRDRRIDTSSDRLVNRVSQQRIFEITGVRVSTATTLFQILALQQRHPEMLKMANAILLMPDLLRFFLTGKRQTEPTIAITTQLYNPRKRAWAADLLGEFGLSDHMLPPLVPTGTMVGTLTKEIAVECRLHMVPVVATASHDAASAVAAAPAEGDNWCYIHSGAMSLVGAELSTPVITEAARRNDFTNEMSVAGKTRIVKAVTGLSTVQDVRRHFASQGQELSASELSSKAAAAEPFRTVIDPDHAPFLEPGDIAKKIDRFADATQQRPPSSPGEFVRTVLEAIAMKYRLTIALLEEIASKRIKTIHIIGPGSTNDLLNQITADACGRPVVAGPVDTSAIGNIVVQAIAMGRIKSIDHARSIVRASFECKRYEPGDTKAWDAAFDRYQSVKQSH